MKQRGFTLIEVIIFIVIVGAGLAGVLSAFSTTVKSSADPMVTKQTVAVAESLLEEILQKEFTKPAGSTVPAYPGGSRSVYDAVSDYNGYTTAAGIVDSQGNAVAGLGAYNVAPPVVVAAATSANNASLNAVGAQRVTVSVTGPQGVVTLVGYRSPP